MFVERAKKAASPQSAINSHILPALESVAVAKLTCKRIADWADGIASETLRVRGRKGADKLAFRKAKAGADSKCQPKSTANRVLTLDWEFDKGDLRTGLIRMANSTGRGGQKGQSGNPADRPQVFAEDVSELARVHTISAMNALVKIVEDTNATPAARVTAANSLLDRGYRKPEAKIDANISRHAVIRSPEPCASVEEWQARYSPCSN